MTKQISPGRHIKGTEIKRLDYTIVDFCQTCMSRTFQKVSECKHVEMRDKVETACTVCGTVWVNGKIVVSG